MCFLEVEPWVADSWSVLILIQPCLFRIALATVFYPTLRSRFKNITLDVPCPRYLKRHSCTDVCVLASVEHSPWILLEDGWNHLEPVRPIRTVLDSPGCALPPLPEMHSCTDAQLPPLSYNTFTCCGDSGVCWHALSSSITLRYHWNILEPPGNLYDPIRTVLDSHGCALPPVPEMHSCTDVQLPPLSYNTFTCSGDLWGVLACVGILHTILEPPGTYTTLYEPSWMLLGVPCPQYLKSIAALMCSYPRFHTIHQALMRIADRFEQRGSFNVQLFSCCFQMALHLCFEN